MSRNTIIGIIVLMIFCLSSAIFMTTREDDKKISLVLGPTEPAGPTEPIEPIEPIEPVVPTEPIEPIEPIEPVVPTEPMAPWTLTDICSSRGKIIEKRTLAGTTEERDSSTDCCYQTDWVGNRCDSDGKIRQTREVAGNCDDLSTERALDCCYKHNWSAYGECKDGWAYSSRDLVGSCSGVAPHKKIRCDEMEFVSETWPFQCGDVGGVEKRCSMSNWTGYTKCNWSEKVEKAYCERRNPYSWDKKTNLSEYNSLGGMEEIFELPS